jgi:hypothetical protein
MIAGVVTALFHVLPDPIEPGRLPSKSLPILEVAASTAPNLAFPEIGRLSDYCVSTIANAIPQDRSVFAGSKLFGDNDFPESLANQINLHFLSSFPSLFASASVLQGLQGVLV